jgi:lipopolysaccharide export LptBFGC system permease protein LptF
MSRTIFWYIFKDLVRVFLMTSGALAGIMSFGGLLRPLTRQGLNIEQVGKVLAYFGPAMTTYSFPIAALFATTMIYGRLSADNELTACRAGGISLVSLSVAGPALVLGLIVAMISLLFLCFVVPACTLCVEKVLYSNFAQLVANHIERTHEIEFGQYTIFAQEAWLPPATDVAPGQPGQQQVVLRGPTIVTDEHPLKDQPDFAVPKEFSTAAEAVVFINQRTDDDQVELRVRLEDGFRFPRKFEDAMQAGVAETVFGPILLPSPIKEDTKFMDLGTLKQYYAHPERSQKLREQVADLVRTDQSKTFVSMVRDQLNGPEGQSTFSFEGGERYVLLRGSGAPPAVLTSPEAMEIKPPGSGSTTVPTVPPDEVRPLTFRRETPGRPASVVHASQLRLRANPTTDDQSMDCSLSLLDCTTEIEQGPAAPRANFSQQFTIPMTDKIAALSQRGLTYYQTQPQAVFLRHDYHRLLNQIIAECHDRASFAISCLILVMVGAALGMIFRSGNFLTAFAVSFVPALVSITLTIAGQRTAGNIPYHDTASDPLMLGLVLIWLGNVINLVIAGGLLLRLHRK